MDEISIFFSWQSDKPEVRTIVFKELDRVQKILIKEGIQLNLEQDTRGRTSAEDIDVAVLEKIRNCDIFLADLTPVTHLIGDNEDVRRDKLMPNSNVMYESGYALGIKGLKRMIFVASFEKGMLMEQMPFDINHKTINPIDITKEKPLSLCTILKNLSKKIIKEKAAEVNEYECAVLFDGNDGAELSTTIHPKYRRITYVPRSKSSMRGSGGIVPVAMVKPFSETTDYSLCPINILVANIGKKSLEHVYVFIKSPDESIKFHKSNVSSPISTLNAFRNYKIDDGQVLRNSKDHINPNMSYTLNEFFIEVPIGCEQILLDWSVQTSCYRREGVLEILVEPEYADEMCELDSKVGTVYIEPYVEHK